ncbi:LOW QUALITY PROTEIN: torsin-2A-like [Macrobrachium nipponense]|uniref:LOW QUALITY PROTEIN: torsin-2A-like n=1 Tax=Macrobrachium nipponense TaxID=159736 RepID=UPI0030C7ABD2
MESNESLVPGLSLRHKSLHRSNSLQPEVIHQNSSAYSSRHKCKNPGRSLTEIYTAKTKGRASSSDPAFSLRRRTLTTVAPLLRSSSSREDKEKFLNRSFSEMSWSSYYDDSSVCSYDNRKDTKEKEDAYSLKDSESLVSNQTSETLVSSSGTVEECEIKVEEANRKSSFLWIILKNCLKLFFWVIVVILTVILIVLLFSVYFTYVKTQCDIKRKVMLPLEELDRYLSESVIGQEIATNVILSSLQDFENNKVNSPLVMWMVGWTGSGKTFSTNILKKVLSSASQIFTVIPSLYPQNDVSELKLKVKGLYDELHPCSFNVIVIDGWDENNLPFEILEQLLSHFRVGVYQQKEIGKTLIVLSGTQGSQNINKEYLRLRRDGRKRESLRVDDFKTVTERETQGRKMLEVLKSYAFVPFLPMEAEQIQKCVTEELSKMNKSGLLPEDYNYKKIIELVIGQLDFIPASYPLLAVTGCKRVQALLQISFLGDASVAV